MKVSTRKAWLTRAVKIALVFQLAWVSLAFAEILSGTVPDLRLLILMMFVLFVPAALEQLTKTKIPLSLHISFAAFITASSIGGTVFGLYALIPHWDTIVHAYSGVMLALFGLFAVERVEHKVKVSLPRWFVLSVVAATPLVFAALWEIAEYLSDLFLHTSSQPGLEDTIIDIIAAAVGAVCAVIYVLVRRKRASRDSLQR